MARACGTAHAEVASVLKMCAVLDLESRLAAEEVEDAGNSHLFTVFAASG